MRENQSPRERGGLNSFQKRSILTFLSPQRREISPQHSRIKPLNQDWNANVSRISLSSIPTLVFSQTLGAFLPLLGGEGRGGHEANTWVTV
jgi:hypothetical protein